MLDTDVGTASWEGLHQQASSSKGEEVKSIKRITLLAIGAGIAVVASMSTPATAASVAVFTGTAHINCFGCGASTGTASLKAIGSINGATAVNVPISASYSVVEASATCPATGSAAGSYSGKYSGNFTWTRVGAIAVISTTGAISGPGLAVFAVTSPLGLPCGKAVTATVAGVLA